MKCPRGHKGRMKRVQRSSYLCKQCEEERIYSGSFRAIYFEAIMLIETGEYNNLTNISIDFSSAIEVATIAKLLQILRKKRQEIVERRRQQT